MKRTLLLFLLPAVSFVVHAQTNYSIDLIHKNILPYASAVVRNQETVVEIKSADNVLTHFKTAITVLNINGDHLARVMIWHNKTTLLHDVKGVIYDSFGKQIRKFNESNFEDLDASHDFSLFEDSRVKYYSPAVTDYPYTISYEYELRSKQTLTLPEWSPNPNTGLAVEKSSFKLLCKPDFNLSYKEINMPQKAVITTGDGGTKSYNWEVTDLKAIREEPYSPDDKTYLSSVEIVPQNFYYDGFTGSFTDWISLGKWTYDRLLTGRGGLPDATISRIKTLTANITDPKEKARKIYEYMQGKTRYISIQIGIGGYQPMLASDVDRLNYGDCKALVNYTHALLKIANIDSWYCVVQAGTPKVSMQPDIASMNQGNHAILCIPFKNDTTWLECTSQQIPFGFLSDFTDDRLVLACTAEGGKLLHTPKYTADANQQIRRATFNINPQGVLSGNMETIFRGLQYDNRGHLLTSSATEQSKMIKNIYPINDMEIASLSFKHDRAALPAIVENLKLTAPDYAKATNNSLNFLINPVNRFKNVPHAIRSRLTPVFINEGYVNEDEITFNIPAGYKLERIPLNVHLNKPFGSYDATLIFDNNHLIYKRTLRLNDGSYAKDIYDELVEFLQKVADADNYSVSMVRTTN
ncbi:DUF3857 domain-containing protein [Mucilaginibacter panaciglaebae]|uniref:DUF3857 domain-containing protein n=1 Tax=Mucilaginibacter panaciglaebae TaxID=502331 RepID=A0ABP7WAN4_9SPHI